MLLRAALLTSLALLLAPVPAAQDGDAPVTGSQAGGRDDDAQEDPPAGGTRPAERRGGTRRGLSLPRRQGGDLAPGSPGRRPELQVPRSGAPATDGATTEPEGSGRVPAASGDPRSAIPRTNADDAADFVFEELARKPDPEASLARRAVESLLAMGEEGLSACRARLSSDEAVELLVSSRVLLRGGTPEDRLLLRQRLAAKVPAGIAQPLLSEFVERDPVSIDPPFLVELLGHATGSMRSAAERELAELAGPDLLAPLAPALTARRSDTRLRAVGLVGVIEDAGALPLLLSALGDGSAKVAARAAELLAVRTDEGLVDALRARAFAGSSHYDAGREGAYALLALVQRADRVGEVGVDDADVPRLLDALSKGDPLASVTAAIALADVGFRSPRAEGYRWLDLEVPHTLVRWGSGAEFHSDFSSVHEHALQRVGLLAGEAYGLDGPAWRSWWAENAGRFQARRAVLAVSRVDAPALAVVLRRGFRAEDSVAFLGPAAAPEAAAGVGRVVYVDVERTEGLFDLFEREGVFGAERLPASAKLHVDGRVVDVRMGAKGKALDEPSGEDVAWFERIVSSLEAIEANGRWQRWFDPQEVQDQRTFWETERQRFSAPIGTPERTRAEIELLLTRLETFSRTDLTDPLERELFEALAERYADPRQARATDFARLTALLAREVYHGERAKTLLELALRAGRADRGPSGDGASEPTSAPGTLPVELGADLLAIVVEQEGTEIDAALASIVRTQGLELARRAAADSKARIRATALDLLAERGGEEEHAILGVLLDDPELLVEVAACRAIARHRVTALAPALVSRARMAPTSVRAAAVKGLALLGDPDAFELARIALYEPELDLQRAAAEAIAELRVPEAAPVLSRLMTRGPNSPLFAPARAGLKSLGHAAADELPLSNSSNRRQTRM